MKKFRYNYAIAQRTKWNRAVDQFTTNRQGRDYHKESKEPKSPTPNVYNAVAKTVNNCRLLTFVKHTSFIVQK